jgi:hypothetical protein
MTANLSAQRAAVSSWARLPAGYNARTGARTPGRTFLNRDRDGPRPKALGSRGRVRESVQEPPSAASRR